MTVRLNNFINKQQKEDSEANYYATNKNRQVSNFSDNKENTSEFLEDKKLQSTNNKETL